MRNDVMVVSRTIAAICRARDALRDFAAAVYADGAHEYVLTPRESLGRASTWAGSGSQVLIGESIGLNGTRTLDMVVEIPIRPGDLAIRGEIAAFTETAEGFDEDTILDLPKRVVTSVDDLLAVLGEFVAEICAREDLLESVAVRKQ